MSQNPPLTVSITLPNGIKYEQPTGLFINNEWVRPLQKNTFEVISPSNEELITRVYESREDDVDVAVKAADKAFRESDWAHGDPSIRGRALNRLADLIEQNEETLASIESYDNGKSLSNAKGDVTLSIACLRSTAGSADKVNGQVLDTGSTHYNFTRREPLGVCGQIIPWNFPLLMFVWKIAPALATGNTVVIKSAETTPLSALYVANLAKENNLFPPGVLNVLSGFGKYTGNALTEHPLVKKIAFTGSTAVGKAIYKKCSENNLKKVTLELGGKSPHLIFDDANIDRAIESVVAGIFYNSGEVCSAGSRLYIQEGVYDEFVKKFVEHAKNDVVVGDPFEKNTLQGAQNSEMQLNKILKYVKIGTDEGAKLLAGGKRIDRKGYYIEPTIFGDVTEEMRVIKEEIFGPLITVSKFKTVEDAIRLANNSEYGLAAGIQSTDLNKVLYVANHINSGTVWVNTYNDFHPSVPFGGYNESGIGREMGEEVLHNYTQLKSVRIKLDPTSLK